MDTINAKRIQKSNHIGDMLPHIGRRRTRGQQLAAQIATDHPKIPGQFPGHFYFPAYKDERVLLALDHDRAWIKRFLDWRPGARLPAEGQGNHLLLGKKDGDQTSIRHLYESAKPVLAIERTMAKDTQLIEVKEGTILIRTEEKT